MRWYFMAVAAIAWAAPALACEFAGPSDLEIVPNAADDTPPSAPKVRVVEVKRGDDWGPDDGCGGSNGSSCDGIAYLKLELTSEDNVTAARALGFRIDDPSARLLGAGRVLVRESDGMLLMQLPGNDSGEHDLKFELTITAVDQAGNESTPTQLTTGSDGSERCQLARGFESGALYTLAMLALLLTRRMRSARGDRTRSAAGSRP